MIARLEIHFAAALLCVASLAQGAIAQTFECRFHEECGSSFSYGSEGGCQVIDDSDALVVFVDEDRAYVRWPGESPIWGHAYYPHFAEISPAVRDLYEGSVAISAANPGAGLHSVRIAPSATAAYSFLTLPNVTHMAYGACQRRGDQT